MRDGNYGEPQADPFELVLHSSYASSSYLAAQHSVAQSSTSEDEWLTQAQQNQQGGSTTSNTHGESQVKAPRRKSNPRILLMGMKGSGKSSVQNVVFQKMSPADTLFLERTDKVESAAMQSFIHFESAVIPAHHAILAPEIDHDKVFANVGAVIWMIDSQDEYLVSVDEFLRKAIFLSQYYPHVNIAVFVHKIDGLTEEYKYDTFRDVRQRVQDELSDHGLGGYSVSYHQTSVFDHSIFEAVSKVVQKLLPQFPSMERLLTKLCSTCRMQKAYIFDTMSKIYIATDTSPTFLKDYEVCSDYLDVIYDIKQLYGWRDKSSDGKSGSKEDSGDIGYVGESIVKYDNCGDTYMYTREINDSLMLVCIFGKGSGADKKAFIDYNVDILQDAVIKIFNV